MSRGKGVINVLFAPLQSSSRRTCDFPLSAKGMRAGNFSLSDAKEVSVLVGSRETVMSSLGLFSVDRSSFIVVCVSQTLRTINV